MSSSPAKSSTAHKKSETGTTAHEAPKEPDDPPWDPGKPLAALMSFMEYDD